LQNEISHTNIRDVTERLLNAAQGVLGNVVENHWFSSLSRIH